MVDILPLKAMRYNTSDTEEISRLISPPYDIISPSQKGLLKSFSDENIVRLILPDDENNLDKYQNASKILNNWLKSNILTIENKECFYCFEESFLENGKWKSFKAFIGLNKIEEYDSKKVLRHEYTLDKPKEDRLNLLRATKANFGLIYTLYEDTDKKIQEILNIYSNKKPMYEFSPKYDETLNFKAWPIEDYRTIKVIIDYMEDKSILIADGHHRYETSRIFKHEIKEKRKQNLIKDKKIITRYTKDNKNDVYPEDLVLTLFVDFNQENIKIIPTHRMIKFKNFTSLTNLKNNFEKFFEVKEYKDIFKEELNDYLCSSNENKSKILSKIQNFMDKNKNKGKKIFCLIDFNQNIYFLTLKKRINEIYSNIETKDLDFENLDVRILHHLLLENILSKFEINDINYTHSSSELLQKVLSDKKFYDLGIILNPPKISDVKKLALEGRVMPQKSTYFYPKPCSGLIMYKMEL